MKHYTIIYAVLTMLLDYMWDVTHNNPYILC